MRPSRAITLAALSVLALSAPAPLARAQCPNTFNYALYCHGNQWVSVPNATSLSEFSQLTVECWVRRDATSATLNGLVSKWNDVQGANQRGYLLWLINGVPTFDISHTGVDYAAVIAPSALDIGVWHHLAGTYDGSMMRLYIDGVQVSQQATTGAIHATPSESLYIGLAKAGAGNTAVWFTGGIDEVRVWSVARSADQIWKNHNVRVSAGAGLVGAWNFDYITTQSVPDSTAGNNTGTLGNTPGVDVFDPDVLAAGELIYPVGVNFPTPAAASAAAAACIPPGTLTLSMSVGFAGATSIQWYKDNVPLVAGPTPSGSSISGQNDFNLVVSNSSAADNGAYRCVVGGCGPWTSNVQTITICGAPPPTTGACCDGSLCSITATAACTGSAKHFSGTGTTCNAPGNNHTPCCRADFNGVGGVNTQDIFDFINSWLAGNARADFNTTGGLTTQDIFDYLNAWFAGC